METSRIKALVSSAFLAGYQRAQTDFGVRDGRLRRKDAERLIKSRGYKPAMLDRWVTNGLLKEDKGASKNSPRTYSLSELNIILTSLEIKD